MFWAQWLKVSLGNKAKSSSEGKTERGGPRLILVPGKSKRPDWEFKVILSYKGSLSSPLTQEQKKKKVSSRIAGGIAHWSAHSAPKIWPWFPGKQGFSFSSPGCTGSNLSSYQRLWKDDHIFNTFLNYRSSSRILSIFWDSVSKAKEAWLSGRTII